MVPSATLARESAFESWRSPRFGRGRFTLTSLALAPWIGGPALVVGSVIVSALVYGSSSRDRTGILVGALPSQWKPRILPSLWSSHGGPLDDRNASATWDNLLVSHSSVRR